MAELQTWVDVDASIGLWETGGHQQMVDGVRMWKTVDDLDRYRQVIAASCPEVIVETGTKWGGSALWFAGWDCAVITVDVDGEPSQAARELTDRVTWLVGDSACQSTADRVQELVAGRRCMVSLDSAHTAPHVAAEIKAYAPLVSTGCYLVVEDGLADLTNRFLFGHDVPRSGGPLRAIERTVATWPGWERDVEVERMSPITHHPAGWWRRVD